MRAAVKQPLRQLKTERDTSEGRGKGKNFRSATRPIDSIDSTASNAIIAIMATITVRNLPEETKRKLKIRAARQGLSLEAEVRLILKNAVTPDAGKKGLGTAIHNLFKDIGGGEVEVKPRQPLRPPPDFPEW